jgi:hypothetical protein
MTTALTIISRALLDLEVLGEGESPTSRQSSDGLAYLNDLIQSLDNEGLTINASTLDSFTLTGATSYTFGTGGVFNSARPVTVESAYMTVDGYDYSPVNILSRDQYDAIADKTSTGSVVDSIFITYEYPLAKVYVYPVASSGTLNVVSKKPLTEPATAATSLSLPVGYERMLRLLLATELMPQYGVQNQMIIQMGLKAKQDIKRVNAANSPVYTGLGLPVGSNYPKGNIYNGGY